MVRAYIAKKHGGLWKNKEFWMSIFIGAVILAIGFDASILAREHLKSALHAQWGPDIFLDFLPVLGLKDFLVWGLELLIVFFIGILFFNPEYIPFSLKSVGLLYLIRSFFIILTPLGTRPDQFVETTKGLFYNLAYNSNDFFFSGHVSFPFMLALIFWGLPAIRWTMFMVAAFFAAAVLLAHTHYSIDVFAVPLIVPTIFQVGRHFFRDDVRFIESRRHLHISGDEYPSHL